MFALVLIILFAAIAVGLWLYRRKQLPDGSFVKEFPQGRAWLAGGAAFALLLCLIFLGLSTIKTVSTKNIGVETAFGKTSGELPNGLHFVAPWVSITEMDAAIQTDNHTGSNCINVRIANQQTACVDISIRWRIKPDQADELFKNYHTFKSVQDSLVTRELTAAVNNQLRNYNPLNSVATTASPAGGTGNPTLTQVASDVTGQMQREIGSQILVLNTIVPIIKFDKQTQARINQLQQQVALTRIAEQEILTNQATAKANAALAASVNNSPNVLVAQCYGILSQMVKNGQKVPAGFSCWPGGGVAAVIAGGDTNTTVTPSK